MKSVIWCRRTFICILSLGCITAVAIFNHTDPSWAIASMAVGLAGANAGESAFKAMQERMKMVKPE